MIGLPVLTYHAIDHSGSVISTDLAWFTATMGALHAEGFQCVDLQDWINARRPAVERGFALAFDDGLSSIRPAAEVIAKYGFVATAFLVTGWMGRDNGWPGQARNVPRSSLLKWSELNDLSIAGFRFGAHTVNHPDLRACSEQEIENELSESRRAIEVGLGSPCNLFAYPYGRSSIRVRGAVARHFQAAFGTRLDVSSSIEDLFALSRIDAYYLRSSGGLKRLLSGKSSTWLRARRAARAVRAAAPFVFGERALTRPTGDLSHRER